MMEPACTFRVFSLSSKSSAKLSLILIPVDKGEEYAHLHTPDGVGQFQLKEAPQDYDWSPAAFLVTRRYREWRFHSRCVPAPARWITPWNPAVWHQPPV